MKDTTCSSTSSGKDKKYGAVLVVSFEAFFGGGDAGYSCSIDADLRREKWDLSGPMEERRCKANELQLIGEGKLEEREKERDSEKG